MTNETQAFVVGIFRDRALAEQAIDDLKAAGWQADQITLVGREAPGVLTRLKETFTHETPAQTTFELGSIALPEEQRQIYQQALDDGSFLVLLEPGDRPLEARELLHKQGAYHVFLPLEIGGERTIPVRAEQMHVQKEVIDVGELRIHKHVITEQRTITVPVTREEVTIERIAHQIPAPPPGTRAILAENRQHDFDQAAAPATASSQPTAPTNLEEMLKDGGTLRILVHEEQILVSKQTVVVEEILLHKQAVQEMQRVVEPLKREEVRIEQVGRVPLHIAGQSNTPASSERAMPS
jgi:stress response protein YsnF